MVNKAKRPRNEEADFCVSLAQNGKVMAALYLVLSVPLLTILALVSLLGGGQLVALPVVIIAAMLYAAGGFLGTVIAAWLYNLVAARVGGFEFTTVEVEAG
jgi:hypothetical protein